MDCMYDYRPEREKAKVVDVCDECCNFIYEGDEYYHIASKDICIDCIDDFKQIAE